MSCGGPAEALADWEAVLSRPALGTGMHAVNMKEIQAARLVGGVTYTHTATCPGWPGSTDETCGCDGSCGDSAGSRARSNASENYNPINYGWEFFANCDCGKDSVINSLVATVEGTPCDVIFTDCEYNGNGWCICHWEFTPGPNCAPEFYPCGCVSPMLNTTVAPACDGFSSDHDPSAPDEAGADEAGIAPWVVVGGAIDWLEASAALALLTTGLAIVAITTMPSDRPKVNCENQDPGVPTCEDRTFYYDRVGNLWAYDSLCAKLKAEMRDWTLSCRMGRKSTEYRCDYSERLADHWNVFPTRGDTSKPIASYNCCECCPRDGGPVKKLCYEARGSD